MSHCISGASAFSHTSELSDSYITFCLWRFTVLKLDFRHRLANQYGYPPLLTDSTCMYDSIHLSAAPLHILVYCRAWVWRWIMHQFGTTQRHKKAQ